MWGAAFGFLTTKLKTENISQALRLGLAIGVISMVGPYLLIPTLMKLFHGIDFWNQEVPMMWDWAAHLVFGASFALYPTIRNRI